MVRRRTSCSTTSVRSISGSCRRPNSRIGQGAGLARDRVGRRESGRRLGTAERPDRGQQGGQPRSTRVSAVTPIDPVGGVRPRDRPAGVRQVHRRPMRPPVDGRRGLDVQPSRPDAQHPQVVEDRRQRRDEDDDLERAVDGEVHELGAGLEGGERRQSDRRDDDRDEPDRQERRADGPAAQVRESAASRTTVADDRGPAREGAPGHHEGEDPGRGRASRRPGPGQRTRA